MKQGDVITQDEAVVLPSNYVGTFTKITTEATGTTPYTGVGFRPSSIIFFSSRSATAAASWGCDDGTSSRGVADNNGVSGSTYVVSDAIENRQSTGIIYAGSISTFDVDGFTISWTRVGAASGTLTVRYMAFK